MGWASAFETAKVQAGNSSVADGRGFYIEMDRNWKGKRGLLADVKGCRDARS